MGSDESFQKDGPWIRSSDGFQVRAVGRSGMEYVRGSERIDLDAEALASPGFVIYRNSVPEDVRERVLADVTRAWSWAGFDVQTIP